MIYDKLEIWIVSCFEGSLYLYSGSSMCQVNNFLNTIGYLNKSMLYQCEVWFVLKIGFNSTLGSVKYV